MYVQCSTSRLAVRRYLGPATRRALCRPSLQSPSGSSAQIARVHTATCSWTAPVGGFHRSGLTRIAVWRKTKNALPHQGVLLINCDPSTSITTLQRLAVSPQHQTHATLSEHVPGVGYVETSRRETEGDRHDPPGACVEEPPAARNPPCFHEGFELKAVAVFLSIVCAKSPTRGRAHGLLAKHGLSAGGMVQ